jgi:secreted trypsin-like serine protease
LERCNSHPEFVKLQIRMTSPHLCAGGEVGQDSCNGDSGGPLVKAGSDGGAFYQIGVVSFGATVCGSTNMPAVYTRVAEFIPWITEAVRI